MKTKLFLILTIFILLPSLLCGCRKKQESSAKSASLPTEKQELVLVTTDMLGPSMEEVIVAFNKENPNYYVTMVDLSHFAGQADSYTAVNTHLTSQNPPDLLQINYLYYDRYKSGNVLTDLTPFLRTASDWKPEDYLPNVLSSYQDGSFLYAIPTQFALSLFIGPAGKTGTGNGWTLENYLQFLEEEPELCLEYYSSESDLLDTILSFYLTEFIDLEKGISHLNESSFSDIIRRIDNLPLRSEYQNENSRQLVSQGYPGLFKCYISYVDAFRQNQEGFSYQTIYMGYPVPDGSSVCQLYPEGALGIPAACKHPEGAWEFISYYLDHFHDTTRFSVKRTILEEQFAKQSQPAYAVDENGEHLTDDNGNRIEIPISYTPDGIPVYALSMEEVNTYLSLIQNARAVSPEVTILKDMVREALAPYFYDDKPLEDVIEKCQRKVQLYLDERR